MWRVLPAGSVRLMWHRPASLLTAITLAVVGLATPAAGHDTTRYYLALGDSLAYGYQPVRPLDRTEGYVYQVHAARPGLTLDNLGCPGETTTTMIDGGICAGGPQLATAEQFLRAHRGRVSLVTLDIGANDINPCARGGAIDDACVTRAYRTIAVNLSRIVFRLRLVAPWTRIVAMTYYNPNLAAYLKGPAGQQLAQRALVVGDRLNAILTLIYRFAGISVADVAAAFGTHDTTTVNLAGFGPVPLNVARVCQWTWMCAPPPLGPDIHANKPGYAVIARTFLAAGAT
jgi:lysophospholipase L1-like esterase